MTFKGRVDIGGETSDKPQFQTLYPELVLEEFKEEDKVEASVDEEKKEKVAKPAVMGYAVLDEDGSVFKFCQTRQQARTAKGWLGGKAGGASIVKVIKGEEVR